MKKFFIVAALFCSLIGTAALAQDAGTASRVYGDPLRHLRPNAGDQGVDNSFNVEVGQLDFNSLPPFMQAQAGFIASCVGNPEVLAKLKFFSYVSDFNRRRGFNPHFLIDTSELKGMKSSNCIFGDICTEGSCLLLGYTANADGWNLSIQRQVYKWSLDVVAIDDKHSQLFFDFLYRPTGECAPPTGIRTDEGCFSKFTWGLNSLQMKEIPTE